MPREVQCATLLVLAIKNQKDRLCVASGGTSYYLASTSSTSSANPNLKLLVVSVRERVVYDHHAASRRGLKEYLGMLCYYKIVAQLFYLPSMLQECSCMIMLEMMSPSTSLFNSQGRIHDLLHYNEGCKNENTLLVYT